MNVDQKTVKHYENQGYLVGKVECRHGRISRDLFGFIDFVALKDGETIAIQATDHTNFSKRIKKIEASEQLARVLETWDVHVLGFKPTETTPHRFKEYSGESHGVTDD